MTNILESSFFTFVSSPTLLYNPSSSAEMDNECYDQITVFWWQSNGIKLDRLISSGFQSPAEAFSSRLSKDGFLIGPNLSRLYEYTTILVHSRCLNNHQFWMNTQRWLISILSKIWMSNIFCGHHFFNSF